MMPIPYVQDTRHTGREESASHAHIMGVYRVPQGDEDPQKEQNHPKKLWESSYKNNFTQFEKYRERPGQSSFNIDSSVDVLEISREALELFRGNNMTNLQTQRAEENNGIFGYSANGH